MFNLEEGIPIATIETKTKARGRRPRPAAVLYMDKDSDEEAPLVSTGRPGYVFSPLPPSLDGTRGRDAWFLSAQSGSGKSYLAAELLSRYRAAGKRVFVLTDIKDKKFEPCTYLNIHALCSIGGTYDAKLREWQFADRKFKLMKKKKAFAEMDDDSLIRLELDVAAKKPKGEDKTRLELKYTEDQMHKLFADSVVLLDDYENNSDIKLITNLRNHLLTKSRHYGCSLIICNHETNFGHHSKLIMGETNGFVLFRNSLPSSREYLLTKKLKWTSEMVRKLEEHLKDSWWLRPLHVASVHQCRIG